MLKFETLVYEQISVESFLRDPFTNPVLLPAAAAVLLTNLNSKNKINLKILFAIDMFFEKLHFLQN